MLMTILYLLAIVLVFTVSYNGNRDLGVFSETDCLLVLLVGSALYIAGLLFWQGRLAHSAFLLCVWAIGAYEGARDRLSGP